ncbi:MAG: thiol-disulfide isomerase/thioredoxin [Glaciecola sp.]|jgi:thiol-disulfide isomerase/thioredoxin
MSLKKRLLFIITVVYCGVSFAQGYHIKFDIKHLDDSVVYLARYYGDNKYIKDTIEVNGKEKFSIKGDVELPCGIYLIVREKRNSYFEFIVSNQNFTVISDTTDFINKTSFEGSPDNEQLYAYFKYAGNLSKRAANIQKELKAMEPKEGEEKQKKDAKQDKKKSILRGELKEINLNIVKYKNDFMINNPNNPMTVVFGMQKEIKIPDTLLNDTSSSAERNKYQYYLRHYWDNTDFSSSCVLRTPVFHVKLQQFFDKYVPQHYDSAVVYMDDLIQKTRINDELFKYVVNYVTFKWESGKEKRMCWDKVFHHMATNYYMKGECTWTDSVQLAKIESRAKDLTYVLCGENPINLQMKYYPKPGLYDTTGTLHELYKVDADYLIMWFWDSDCGHCKTQTPKLWDMYKKYKEQGLSIEVYAINVEQESKGYKDYLQEHKYTWINVQDTGNFSAFRKYYDIYSTPVAYILNKERELIGKRLDPEAIDTFLEQYIKEKEVKVGK